MLQLQLIQLQQRQHLRQQNSNSIKQQPKLQKAAAESLLDNFDDRFLGAKTSNPTVDNDGDALTDGALYFDTTNNVMKVYDLSGTQWRQIQLQHQIKQM